MNKVKLDIYGLSYSQTQSGAYVLQLTENNGKRSLPIVIGGFEAQAIALELERMTPSRPLTHDLFKSFALAFNIQVSEVIIYNLDQGIFYAKLICDLEGVRSEIDARTSDAIAIAVRFRCPIYTYESILASAGVILDEEQHEESGPEEELAPAKSGLAALTMDELNEQLGEAIENEEYERASLIRDEINRRNVDEQ